MLQAWKFSFTQLFFPGMAVVSGDVDVLAQFWRDIEQVGTHSSSQP
jgi:hypothetical protein